MNHMSAPFQEIMNDLHTSLTNAYNTQHAVMLPGSGTYAVEAAARAFGHEGDVVVVRNGYFSYRWSQLFECMGKSDDQVHVMKARPVNGWSDEEDRGVQPPPIEEVVAKIRDVKPSMVCAPHVETSAGIILNKDYCKQIGDACKEVGATSCPVDLHKWKTVMGAYRDGGHMYHATMPTDAIKIFRDVVHETEKFGLKEAEKATWDLG